MKELLLVNKEKGLSSFDVVKSVRKIFQERSVGHAGTLDPLATGLLIIAVGEATKFLEYFSELNKEYETVAMFGYKTETYDAEGVAIPVAPEKKISKKEISKMITDKFMGKIRQTPPLYSAAKISGKRAYDLVRKGEDFELKAREVEIFHFKILTYKWPEVKFQIKCSKGTYIRSLINDLGEKLKVGAYIKELKRIAIGPFEFKKASSIDDLSKKIEQSGKSVTSILKKLAKYDKKKFGIIKIEATISDRLKNGQFVKLNKKIEQHDVYFGFVRSECAMVLKWFPERMVIKMEKLIR